MAGIWSATEDGRTILVSHTPIGPPTYTGDLTVEHDAQATVVATSGVNWAQFFSSSGNAFLFSVDDRVHLARADGTVVPNLELPSGAHDLIGRWLYYRQQPSGGAVQIFRLLVPDGSPQFLAKGSSASSAVFLQISADGEAYATCESGAPTCSVALPDAAAPIVVPNSPYGVSFSPDDKWALSGCTLVDAQGASRNLGCVDDSVPASFSQDGTALVATLGGAATVVSLITGEVTRLPPAPQPLQAALLTPNARRVIGRSGDHAFVISSSGGAWTTLTTDAYSVFGAADFPIGIAISPDSRIIAANSISKGVVESIEGVDGVRTILQDGKPMLFATPVFEPPGGHGRAIFYESGRTEQQVIGNADGSGEWTEIPIRGYAGWTGHSFLSWTPISAEGPYDLFVTPAIGERIPLVSGVRTWLVTGPVDHPVLLFVPMGGGLYSIPVPQPPPP